MQTADDIMDVLEKWAREKRPIAPHEWVDAAAKLNVLQGHEDDKLMLFEQVVAKMRVALLDAGNTAAAVKIRIEATDEYAEARHQKAKIDRVKEVIRIAKLRGRLASEELRSQ